MQWRVMVELSGADGSVQTHEVHGGGCLPAVCSAETLGLTQAQAKQLLAELQPLVTTFEGHPWDWAGQATEARNPRASETSRWNAGKDLSFVPLRPERVVEVRYDHMEGERFRHTAQFNRWRPDRDPRSCTYEQLERPVIYALDDIVDGLGR